MLTGCHQLLYACSDSGPNILDLSSTQAKVVAGASANFATPRAFRDSLKIAGAGIEPTRQHFSI